MTASTVEAVALWEALRGLTDDERRAIERALEAGSATVVVGSGAGRRELAPRRLVLAVVRHLHGLVHEQQAAAVVDGDATEPRPSPPTLSKPMVRAPTPQRQPPAQARPFQGGEDDFPALGAAAAAQPTKRRITTTLVTARAPVVVTTTAKPTPQPTTVWNTTTLLERRMTSNGNTAGDPNLLLPTPSSTSAPDGVLPAKWASPPSSQAPVRRKPPSLSLNGKQKRAPRVELTTTPSVIVAAATTTSIATPATAVLTVNQQAAHLFGFFLAKRLVPSWCSELRLLIGLLYRPSCPTGSTMDSVVQSACMSPNEFCVSDNCKVFASIALEAAQDLVLHLSSDILGLIRRSLGALGMCPRLVARMDDAIERREEHRVSESSQIGYQLPIETKVSSFRDFTLPFCKEMDSRLNYRTPSEVVIYSNREKIRDEFLNQLRSYQKRQHGILGGNQEMTEQSAVEDARSLLGRVMPQNLWWFARFFVQELVQVGSSPLAENDKELVKKITEGKTVANNADKLRKLHRRMSTKKASDTPTNSRINVKGQSSGKNNGQGGPSMTSGNNARDHGGRTSKTETGAAIPKNPGLYDESAASYDRMQQYFSENQAFFYHFLHSCDSYKFAEMVKHHLEGQFLVLWHSETKSDPRKEFTERTLQLKVLAKFIGFLRFSPQWNWTTLANTLSVKNEAFEASRRDAIQTLESAQQTQGFDPITLMQESICAGQIALCIPWVCDYLIMICNDIISSSTSYYRRAFALLSMVHRSRRLLSMGETGMYVAMQLEKLFCGVNIDEILPHHDLFCERSLTGIDETVVAVLGDSNETDKKLDDIPFLYSRMVVQVCLEELEDLRGYLQTQSNPHVTTLKHSRRAATSNNSYGKVAGVRKVRPLQVMVPEQLDITRLPQFDESMNDADNGLDALEISLFKLQPPLKRAVEFVVDMVITNIREYVVNKCVVPAADKLVDGCEAESKVGSPIFTNLIFQEFQTRLEHRLDQSLTDAVIDALAEANSVCGRHIGSAMQGLCPPSTPKALIASATKIAMRRARTGMSGLIKSSARVEFLKRVNDRRRLMLKETTTGASAKAETESVARALRFSFDGSDDDEESSLNSTWATLKQCCVGIVRLTSTPMRPPDTLVKSYARYTRNLSNGISELTNKSPHCTKVIDTVLRSWSWRAVRSSATYIIAISTECCHATPARSSEHSADCCALVEFVAHFRQILCAIIQVSPHGIQSLKKYITQCVHKVVENANRRDLISSGLTPDETNACIASVRSCLLASVEN